MTQIQIKLLVAGVILAGAIGYLAFAGVKSGWVYFIDVKTYLADPQYRAQRVRLHGSVAAEGFEMSSAGLRASFRLIGTDAEIPGGPSVPVVYRGNVPEMFGVGKNVVVEGRADAAGVFEADVLMTKCASKYESGSPHAEAKP